MPKGVYPRHVKRHAVTQPEDQSIRLIPLTQGQNAIVDAADYEWLNQWNWCVFWNHGTRSFYVRRREKGINIYMHRLIVGCGPNDEADHRDHNTLDNRRCNLRKCSHAENTRNHRIHYRNSSGINGVTWNKANRKWLVRIGYKYIGYYSNKKEANEHRKQAEQEVFGEFAVS